VGFLGCVQMNFLEEIIKIREKNFKSIYKIYQKNNNFLKLDLSHMNIISNFAFPIICKNNKLLKKYVSLFMKNNIEIRPLIAGNITLQPFFKKYIKTKFNLPNSTLIHKNAFYIPNHPDLSQNDIKRMTDILL
jgi:CDP-6-deoxy-D-xylo-4-hexulose-3-dehydrase